MICEEQDLTENEIVEIPNSPTSPLSVLVQLTNVEPFNKTTGNTEAVDSQILGQPLPAPCATQIEMLSLSPTPTCSSTTEPFPSTSCASEPKLNKNNTLSSKRQRKVKQNKQYFDYYLSEEEDFSTIFGGDFESDTYIPTSDSSDSDNENNSCNQKKPKKPMNDTANIISAIDQSEHIVGENAIKQPRKNKKKERQNLKRTGQAYTRSDGSEVPAKEVKPNPCTSKKCGNDCGSITEEKRKSIHTYYWNLSVTRRRDWLVSMTQKTAVKRKRTKDSDKRSFTFKYSITEGEGKRPVCLQFLAATLDVGTKFIQYTIQNSELGLSKEDNRGRCEPHNKTKETTMMSVMNFFKGLPAIPSHYCRKDSSRVYLPKEMKNLANLYKIYKKTYTQNGVDIVSERVFRTIFREKFNIGFHVPKKDKCLKCLKYEQNIDNPDIQEEKKQHELEKTESYNRFKAHQNINKTDPTTLCASFDLQKVLNTPYGDSMLLFYSRKLAVYNFCVYENGTRNVFCYYWDESNGKRGANEIGTILSKYIHTVDERGTVKHLLLYCDCCPGQNRNRIILAMLHTTLQACSNITTIQINFLLTGHTYMPVDSVHAVIERNLKNNIIYAPSQWYTIFSTARQDPGPYNVEVMQFKDFYRWDSISEKYFKGNLTGKISKMRVVTFQKKKENMINVKNSMNEDAVTFSIEVQPKTKINPPACYKSQIPLSKAKLDDLLKLCRNKVIPSIFHNEYNSLTSSNNVKDTLPESDIEDVDEQ